MADNKVSITIEAKDKASAAIGKMAEDASKNISGMSDTMRSALNKTSVVMATAGAGLSLYAKSATDFTVGFVKDSKTLARETGSTVEEVSRLVFATQRMGLTAEQASANFGIFSRKITEVADASGKNAVKQSLLRLEIKDTEAAIVDLKAQYSKAGANANDLARQEEGLTLKLTDLKRQLNDSTDGFARLGVNVKDAAGKTRPFNELLLAVADKFTTLKDGSEKTAIAMDLFGRSGRDMLPFLNKGSEGIQSLQKRADELGLTLTAQTVGSISKYIESQKALTDSSNALKLAVGQLTAPVLTELNTGLNEVMLKIVDTDSPLRGLTATVLAFGGPALTFGASAIGVAANLVTIAEGAGKARAMIVALQASAAVGIALPVAGAVAALGMLTLAIMETDKAIDKVKSNIDDLNKRKVKINGTGPEVSATSGTGLVQQLRSMFSPGFASGTSFAPGGVSLVGEEGPELVNLPRGAQVIPARQTADVLARGAGDVRIEQTNYIYNEVDLDRANRELGFRLATRAA